MKKILFLLIGLLCICNVYADESNEIVKLNIKFEQNVGTNVNETKINMEALYSTDLNNYVNIDDKVLLEDVKWYRYEELTIDDTCENYEYCNIESNNYGILCTNEDVFIEDENYILYIGNISFSEDIIINIVDNGILINNEEKIENLEYENTENGISITIKNLLSNKIEKNIELVEDIVEDIDIEENVEETTCMLNLPICCISVLDISICIWIIILIVLIIIIRIICVIVDKKNDKKFDF